MSRILISGASGFIGRPLVSFLRSRGHSVCSLSRESQAGEIVWNPEAQKANLSDFEGFDAVIHLAGEPLTLSRWTKKKRDRIFNSRVEGTLFLSRLLKSVAKPPKIFLSASAVGFYGDRGEELLTEDSSSGSNFLARVCREWEMASLSLLNQGIRVVHARFGLVLDSSGGLLQKLLFPFRLGLGGRLGSGNQWISWIKLQDLVRALCFLLDTESFQGPVNLVAPQPVRQREFARILAKNLHRPHFFRIPAWLLRLLFGEAAALVLASQKVKSAKLLASNFDFKYLDLRSAVYHSLQF